MPPLPFKDRRDAGRQLAARLSKYRNANAVVLALPRGGVPVGFEVAEFLNLPLDVFLVRKLRVPKSEELALGAIASGGVLVLNHDIVFRTGVDKEVIDAIAERERKELERRELAYHNGRQPVSIDGRTALLVDDGLATGATMLAAARAVRKLRPEWLVVAVPVAAPETCAHFRNEVDEFVCEETPRPFRAVGLWYEEFPQTCDEEVRNLITLAAQQVKH